MQKFSFPQKHCTNCRLCYIRDDFPEAISDLKNLNLNRERIFKHMTANTRHKSTQPERDLEQKRQELATLKNRLCQKERVKLNLQWETTDFKKIYTESLSPRIEELDMLKKQLADIQSEGSPEKLTTFQPGEAFSFMQNEEADQEILVHSCKKMTDDVFPNIKELYRKVAKAIHPDLSSDDEERTWRQKLMAEANNAYANEDGDSLQSILHQWVNGHVPGNFSGISAELTHLVHKIFQVNEKLRKVEAEIFQLKNSDLYQLMTRIEEALYDGVDLLAEIAATIDEEIALIRRQLPESNGKLNGLNYLTLSSSKVTEKALNKLRETLPGCRVSLLQSGGKR